MSNETSTTPAAGAIPPINWPVFIWAAIGAIAITLWAFLAPENAESVLGAVVGGPRIGSAGSTSPRRRCARLRHLSSRSPGSVTQTRA